MSFRIYYENGDFYEGQWRENNKHGEGKYLFKDGGSEEGYYFNGKQHGKMLYSDLNGNLENRFYEYGELFKIDKIEQVIEEVKRNKGSGCTIF